MKVKSDSRDAEYIFYISILMLRDYSLTRQALQCETQALPLRKSPTLPGRQPGSKKETLLQFAKPWAIPDASCRGSCILWDQTDMRRPESRQQQPQSHFLIDTLNHYQPNTSPSRSLKGDSCFPARTIGFLEEGSVVQANYSSHHTGIKEVNWVNEMF